MMGKAGEERRGEESQEMNSPLESARAELEEIQILACPPGGAHSGGAVIKGTQISAGHLPILFHKEAED